MTPPFLPNKNHDPSPYFSPGPPSGGNNEWSLRATPSLPQCEQKRGRPWLCMNSYNLDEWLGFVQQLDYRLHKIYKSEDGNSAVFPARAGFPLSHSDSPCNIGANSLHRWRSSPTAQTVYPVTWWHIGAYWDRLVTSTYSTMTDLWLEDLYMNGISEWWFVNYYWTCDWKTRYRVCQKKCTMKRRFFF